MSHYHEDPQVPSPTDFEPVFRAPLDFHPKFIAGGVGGLAGLVISWLGVRYLNVELEPETAVAIGAVVANIPAGILAYLRSSKSSARHPALDPTPVVEPEE